MSKRAGKRAIKRPSADPREAVSTGRPAAPLSDADLDRVVGGSRQTPKTDFGSVLGRGISKASE